MRENMQTFATLYHHLGALPENETFLNHLKSNRWKHCSKTEFLQTVRYLTLAFEAKGWRGKQIALAIDPSVYWLMIDYALILSGAVSVPLFTNISTKNLRFEIADADIHTAFTQTEQQAQIIREANDKVVCIDIDSTCENCLSIESLSHEGKKIDKNEPEKFETLLSLIQPNDLVTIVYTSGTSGLPKGVELSHQNLISQIIDTGIKYKFDATRDIALSFLPLAHIFERMVIHFYVSTGMSIYFADDVKNVGNLLRSVHPTVMTVVPRLLEKVYFKMHTKAMQGNPLKKLLIMIAFKRANEKDPTQTKNILDKLLEKLVYSKLRTSLGGNLRMMISGGAPLWDDLYRFFINIGIPVYQGYGLTEASPVICANAPGENKIGTCGKHFVHTQIKIADDGELLAKGPGIMIGYHNNQKMTDSTIDKQGWLHTGDLASVDEEGYISITGRKKDLSKTSTGEYISVNHIEQLLMASGWFDHVIIVGNNRPFVVALLMLNEEVISKYGYHDNRKTNLSKKVHKEIKNYIESINKKLNHWEKIRDFHLVSEILTIEDGYLTPSMKLSKESVEKRFKNEIEKMYEKHI